MDEPIPKVLENASREFDSWRRERLSAIPTQPDTLYHYTNATALMSIFEARELWATNAVYTNDRTEVLHSLLQLKRIVEKDLKDRRADPASDTMLIVVEEFYTIVEVYLACFCASDDLLSQWRGYGQQGGYAIGFVASGLAHLLRSGHVMLIPVIYDEAEQDRIIRDLVKRWRSVFIDAAPDDDNSPNRKKAAWVFAQIFAFLAIAFKDAKFAEEQEWRLVYRRQRILPDDGSGLKVSYRERYGMVTPYVKLNAAPPHGINSAALLPVHDIVMGPTTDSQVLAWNGS